MSEEPIISDQEQKDIRELYDQIGTVVDGKKFNDVFTVLWMRILMDAFRLEFPPQELKEHLDKGVEEYRKQFLNRFPEESSP